MKILTTMNKKTKYNNKNRLSIFTRDLANIDRKRVMVDSLTKLNPLYLARTNAVMFTVEVVFLVVLAVGLGLSSIPKVYASQSQVFYYESAAILIITVWFATFSEALSEAQARARVDSLRSLEKEVMARKLVGEGESRKEVVVTSTSLKPGDEVLVYAGEIIPRDGLVCEGKAFIDESMMTGESNPVFKEKDDHVIGGTRIASDKLRIGGVETKAVTEFYGPPNSGKTQLCHTMCVIVPQDKFMGGVGGKSIYLDTEGRFRAERIAAIVRARGFDLRKTLDNIIIEQPEDSNEQEQVLDKIGSLLKNQDTKRFKLLVVDSPVAHYRGEYIGRAMLPERQQKLYRFMRRLVTIACAYNIAVVVTNQINTTPDSQEMFGNPIGGNAMSHAVTYGIRLGTRNQIIHSATIVSSPYHPRNSKTFRIGTKGLEDD
jgi:RecA/RadA recombinase